MKPLALIIEDDLDQSFIFVKALELAGYETEPILDGGTAQRRLMETVPALIVLDLHLPGVNGVDLLRQIRADERLAETSIMVLTADGRLAESLRSQATKTVIKPVGFAQLTKMAAEFRPPTKPRE